MTRPIQHIQNCFRDKFTDPNQEPEQKNRQKCYMI